MDAPKSIPVSRCSPEDDGELLSDCGLHLKMFGYDVAFFRVAASQTPTYTTMPFNCYSNAITVSKSFEACAATWTH